MKEIKFYLPDMKRRWKTAQTREYVTMVLIGAATSITILFIVGAFILTHQAFVLNYLESAYANRMNAESTVSGDSQGITPFSQESLVVSVVRRATPAVVSIVISKDVPKYEEYSSPLQDPFGFFGNNSPFGQFFSVPQYRQNGTEKQEIGGGSGFLISSDGLIVTNRHVVEDTAAEYTVYTNDGEKHPASVVARDQVLDIALIQIDGAGYPYLTFGDSDALEVGQTAIAIGNALGEFQNSVSVGVVSGLSRSIVAGDMSGQSEALDQVIQTDAAINPGNSGGPLLDLQGHVIGVDVAVAQGSQSIGFALPVNSIKSVVESVQETGKIIRPYLGIRYTEVTPEMKDKNKLTVDYGALVQRGETASDLAVIPGSPANKAGIVEGDIILSMDGVKLDKDHHLASMVREKKVGDTITLLVLHQGQEKIVRLTLEAAPE